MSELKPLPCPFCGCELEQRYKQVYGNKRIVYMHPNNGCVLLSWYVDGTNIFAWNRRVGEGENNASD